MTSCSILQKTYVGPYNQKVRASSYDEAAIKIVKKLKSSRFRNKHDIWRAWHRIRVVNESTQSKKYYLVDDDEVKRCDPFEPSALDYASESHLIAACNGICLESKKISPDLQKTITLNQARVQILSKYRSSYELWDKFVNKSPPFIFGSIDAKKVWIYCRANQIIRIGVYGVGFITLDSGEGLLSQAMSQKREKDTPAVVTANEDEMREKHKVKINLLKRKIKMLEKSMIRLEAENEKLRWDTKEHS